MKKVGFITIHAVQNFGSILQTIATFKMLKDLGCNPTLINYIPERYTWKRFFKALHQFVDIICKDVCNVTIVIFRRRKFSSYLQKYVTMTKPIIKNRILVRFVLSSTYI